MNAFVVIAMAVVAVVNGYDVQVHPQTTKCAQPPTATVQFVPSCTVVDVKDAACWTPHPPSLTDVVEFPANTNAEVKFAKQYHAVRAKTVILAKGATVLMTGGAFEVSECFFVQGNLNMKPTQIDNGTVTFSGTFLGDATMPFGQDCKTINAGFTPRVCGPGDMIVQNTVNMQGLYASLFLRTIVQRGASLSANGGAFLWGNTTNYGSLRNDEGNLYFHGAVTNYHELSFTYLRADKWLANPSNDKKGALMVYNEGFLVVFCLGPQWNMEPLVTTLGFDTYLYRLKIVNKGQLTFSSVKGHRDMSSVWASGELDIMNMKSGVVVWNLTVAYQGCCGEYHGTGSSVNMGTFVAANTRVRLGDYLSEGGHLVTKGGSFHFGNGAGVDMKTTAVCKKSTRGKTRPLQLPVSNQDVVQTNQTCDPKQWNSCPFPLCCGASKKCETARCQKSDGYSGGPSCCQDNAFCGGSSHGPYCGNGAFSWQIDSDCVEDQKFVDRYEFDAVKNAFMKANLPTFGRSRYTFRGDSTISGDGADGRVVFTEPIEVRGTLRIASGGALRAAVEEVEPFRGDKATVVVASGGKFVSGIKTRYETQRIRVERGGEFHVPRHTAAYVKTDSMLSFNDGAQVNVDGSVFLLGSNGNSQLFCNVAGRGTVVSEEPRECI